MVLSAYDREKDDANSGAHNRRILCKHHVRVTREVSGMAA